MKRLFIHHPLFRLLSPLFSGTVVYLLILLINNNVEQLQEQFLGQELYVCIGLSFLIQEFARLLLLIFNRFLKNMRFLPGLLLQVFLSLLLCVVLVTAAIHLYYKYALGFTPNSEELWLFNSIFCSVTLIYILLHLSHLYLYKENTSQLRHEMLQKEMVEEDFVQFREGINPELLLDSFEALIVRIRKQGTGDEVDDLIDRIAATYRYVLSKKEEQLVPVTDEMEAMDQLAHLINYLPYRAVSVVSEIHSDFLCVPGSFLKVLEQIVRGTIRSDKTPLSVKFGETGDAVEIKYHHNDRLDRSTAAIMEKVRHVYGMYSTDEVTVTENHNIRSIHIPKLNLKDE